MTSEKIRDYKIYVSDPSWAQQYSDYQKKYESNPRESDKKSASLVLSALRGMQPLYRSPRILDIGCSTGNFLRHLQTLLPSTDLVGGDLMVPVIEQCRRDSGLRRVEFQVMDVFAIPTDTPFDVVVANAVNVYFEEEEYERAVKSIFDALQPDGTFVAYEWVFPDDREQRIVEKSNGHPEGLKFWFRSEDKVRSALSSAGFVDIDIQPFDIPIDLPKPQMTGTDADLITYTVRDQVTGRRLMFRGTLYQPWAHIVARKPASNDS
jgi:SAM-dependent methyltransferase